MKLSVKHFIFIVLPTCVAILYFGLWATDMYVSESRFSIRSPEGGGSSELLALFGQGGGSTISDAYILEDYILSQGLLFKLDKELGIKQHYQTEAADFFSRLKKNPSAEDFQDYFRDVINVHFDAGTGILGLKVRAYDADMAKAVNTAILKQSEQLVNNLRDRAMHDLLSLSKHEVDVSEQRLKRARQKMKEFRQDNDLLDPKAAAGAVQGLVTDLEGQAAKVKTELAELRSYMKEESVPVVGLKAKIRALEQQVEAEKSRLTGEDSQVMNEVVAQFEELALEHEFAQNQYVSALSSLEAARVRAESQSRYLEAFVEPTLPDDARWPQRGLGIGLSFVFSLLIYGIGSLIVAAVREHAGR